MGSYEIGELPKANKDKHNRGGLDLAVPFTPFTPIDRTEIECWSICTGVLWLLGLPRWCRQNSHVTCSKTR